MEKENKILVGSDKTAWPFLFIRPYLVFNSCPHLEIYGKIDREYKCVKDGLGDNGIQMSITNVWFQTKWGLLNKTRLDISLEDLFLYKNIGTEKCKVLTLFHHVYSYLLG